MLGFCGAAGTCLQTRLCFSSFLSPFSPFHPHPRGRYFVPKAPGCAFAFIGIFFGVFFFPFSLSSSLGLPHRPGQ